MVKQWDVVEGGRNFLTIWTEMLCCFSAVVLRYHPCTWAGGIKDSSESYLITPPAYLSLRHMEHFMGDYNFIHEYIANICKTWGRSAWSGSSAGFQVPAVPEVYILTAIGHWDNIASGKIVSMFSSGKFPPEVAFMEFLRDHYKVLYSSPIECLAVMERMRALFDMLHRRGSTRKEVFGLDPRSLAALAYAVARTNLHPGAAFNDSALVRTMNRFNKKGVYH